MNLLKAKLTHWLLGNRIERLETFASDATGVVNAILDYHNLDAHEVEELDPTYRPPTPPTRKVMRIRKRK